MDVLNFKILKYYHKQLKNFLKNIQEKATYKAGKNITIDNNVISATVPDNIATIEYVDTNIASTVEYVDNANRATSGILNVFYSNITWQDE